MCVARWPGPQAGMLTYITGAALYLAFLGVAGGLAGILLWPAVALHVLLSVLIARCWAAGGKRKGDGKRQSLSNGGRWSPS